MATDLPSDPHVREQYEYWEKKHEKGRQQFENLLNYVIFAATILVAFGSFLDLPWFDDQELPPPDAAIEEVEALDDDARFEWWMREAQRGSALGQYHVARSYRLGEGVEQDDAQAMKWYLRSAEQGNVGAQVSLAAYYEGNGPFARDVEKAIYWHERAAELGAVGSAYRLYVLHRGSESGPADRVRAYMWLYIAAERGHGHAPEVLPVVEAALTDAEYEQGRQMARDWLQQH